MSINNAIRNYTQGIETLGKSAMNIKYPDEFEVYMIALELLDSKGKTLNYFIFPVMPSTLSDDSQQIHNVKKTLGGVSVLSTVGFVPTDINLVGNFGRRFRVLLGGDWNDVVSSFKDNGGQVTKGSFKQGVKEVFDDRVKTGYGCCKVLESIVNNSNVLDDDGGVKTLIFHNLALGNSYVVKSMGLVFSQSQETNMIWGYTLKLKSIAPLSALYTSKQLQEQRLRLNVQGYAQSRVDSLVNKLTSTIARLPISPLVNVGR